MDQESFLKSQHTATQICQQQNITVFKKASQWNLSRDILYEIFHSN